MISLLKLSVLAAFAFTLASTFPFHAQCTLEWDFDISCDEVRAKLVDQIKAWNGPTGCQRGGEKCDYKLVTNTPTKLTATHTTPKKHYVDKITVAFIPAKGDKIMFSPKVKVFSKWRAGAVGCTAEALSVSKTWYAILDYGTNYCNLHNLVVGSGLDMTAGFQEKTTDEVCTQYSSANCEKY